MGRCVPKRHVCPVLFATATLFACGDGAPASSPPDPFAMTPDTPAVKYTRMDPPNELGFARVTTGEGGTHAEGIIDARGVEIVPPRTNFLVNDITASTALVQSGRAFLFVDLSQGPVDTVLFGTTKGYEYAEPFRYGRTMVKLDDRSFHIDTLGEVLNNETHEFAETFHEGRALVMSDNQYRIIDPVGRTIARLNYDQVSPQSPWCWQVIRAKGDVYWSGFVDLNGKEITPLIYDEVGYYDPEVKRIRVGQGDKFGFLDEHAQVAVPIIYEQARVFDKGKALVTLDGREFYIDPSGRELLE